MKYYSNITDEIVEAWQVSNVDFLNNFEDLPEWVKTAYHRGQLNYRDAISFHLHTMKYGTIELYENDFLVYEGEDAILRIKWKAFTDEYAEYPESTEDNPEFTIDRIEDHDDGSATLYVDMSQHTLKIFASIGLHKVIMDATKITLKENGS